MSGPRVETVSPHAGWLASERALVRHRRVATIVLLKDSLLSIGLLGALGALILAVPVVGQLLAF